MPLYVLYESASGFALFERLEGDEIGDQLPQMQQSLVDMGKLSKIIKLKAFTPFSSEKNALEEINAVSEGVLTDFLKNFIETNLPKSKGEKKSKIALGVTEEKLAQSINETLSVSIARNEMVAELTRGIRLHFNKFLKDLKDGDIEKAQLGLGHAYSRGKVKFNVNRVDNMIIQSISLLDQLEKDLNTFSMRVREWYGWHFPELVRVVPDNTQYAAVTRIVQNKATFTEEKLPAIEDVLGSAEKAKEVLEAARHSMGTDINELDMMNIQRFAGKVVDLSEYRKKLHAYLQKKMHDVAPNLATLIGEHVGARLISHAGSLTSLAKYPASTVQILGAEKALFRALKTRGNTPKYGLIFHSSFIGKAGTKNKGRISRYLANKCSIAARIDCFSDDAGTAYGEKLKEQVTERLEFYESGQVPRKNIDVMKEALIESKKRKLDIEDDATPKKQKKDKKKDATPKASEKKEKNDDKMDVDTPKSKKGEKKGADTPKEKKSAETPKEKKSADTPKEKKSADTPKEKKSADTPKEKKSAETPKEKKSAETPKEKKSAETPKSEKKKKAKKTSDSE